MEARDLIVTPVIIMVVYLVAYLIRPRVTDDITRVYFIPALTVKIIGAISVGLIYQFYYGGGDTFNYHTHGSRHIWEALSDSPLKWLKLVFGDGVDEVGIYRYTSRIAFWRDPSSYAVVRVAAIFDLFTLSTYSATAVLFAVFSFVGMWMLFVTFYEEYSERHLMLAVAMFFIPSVFFWGSGLLKDTLTLGSLGMATYAINRLFIRRQIRFISLIVLMVSFLALYEIKLYILLVYLPSAVIWIFLRNLDSIRSVVVKAMSFPLVIVGAAVVGYFAMVKASEDSAKYSVSAIAKTAQITAYDIRYYTGRDAGSGYSLGELDGTLSSMVRLAPQAINASLYRPYLWEVSSPLMLLSALESAFFLMLTVLVIIKENMRAVRALIQPDVLFSIIFSFVFAFAVGVSTYNFGTLVRYKIPMLPFFALSLILIADYSKRERKVGVFEFTEYR